MSLAGLHGRLAKTLWEHPDDATAKKGRTAPDLPLAGDRLSIPRLRMREAGRATEPHKSSER